MKCWLGSGSLMALALSISVSAYAEAPATGVQGGTYYNVPGKPTTFTPPGGQPATASAGTNFSNGAIRLTGDVAVKGAVSGMQGDNAYVANGGSVASLPINSVNNGAIAKGGTYFNTANGKTTFTNTSGGGIWLKGGSNIRGVEVDATGNLTNNGGTVHFYAPGSVVRLDGNIDIRAVRDGNGNFKGNGGNLFVDSSYLYQNGSIYANGINGGLVQFNVGAATFGGTSRIEAKGFGGQGGVISINASGPVDVGRQTVFDSSGKVIGTLDTNLINIEGGLVNVAGNLYANGVESRGGTIRIVATGQSNLSDTAQALTNAVTAGTFTASEKNTIEAGLSSLKNAHDGDIVIAAGNSADPRPNVWANGFSGKPKPPGSNSGNDPSDPTERAGDGGTVILTAQRDIQNDGWVQANGGQGSPSNADPAFDFGRFTNGGHGGTVSLNAGANIVNIGRITADGGAGGYSIDLARGLNGGSGGLIAASYRNQILNNGTISVQGGRGASFNDEQPLGGAGGNGGLALFAGASNLAGTGTVVAFGGHGGSVGGPNGRLGTIVAPDPATSTNTLIGIWRKTQPVELLTHAENLLLLTKDGGSAPVSENLFARMLQAHIRSVEDPTGSLGQARAEVISKNTETSPYVFRNLILGSSRAGLALALNHPFRAEAPGALPEFILPSPLSNGQAFTTLNTLTVLNNGSVSTQIFPGQYIDEPTTPTNFWLIGRNSNSLGGGRISVLTQGEFQNHNIFGTVGRISGGSVNIAAANNIVNTAYSSDQLTTAGDVHGGSILVKSGQSILLNRVNYFEASSIRANGGLIGGRIYIAPLQDFIYESTLSPASQIAANGSLQAGIIEVHAGNNSEIKNNPDFSGRFISIQANGTSPTEGRGGYIYVHSKNLNVIDDPEEVFQVNGGVQNGTVSLIPAPVQ